MPILFFPKKKIQIQTKTRTQLPIRIKLGLNKNVFFIIKVANRRIVRMIVGGYRRLWKLDRPGALRPYF